MLDNIKEIILNELIREDEEIMQTKGMLNDPKTYDRSYSLLKVLEHVKYPQLVKFMLQRHRSKFC